MDTTEEMQRRKDLHLIYLMWSVKLLVLMFLFSGAAGPAVFFDFIAVGIALNLVCRERAAPKINGWIVLGMELFVFLTALLSST